MLFIRDGEVFHQIYRGTSTNEQLYQKISDTLTLLATGGDRNETTWILPKARGNRDPEKRKYVRSLSPDLYLYDYDECYLMRYLGANPVIAGIKGGRSVQEMLGMGNGVFIIFSLIFLFYTNSFLIRRRKREFGLYNILGMGKWNLARILVWECILTTAVSLLGGLLLGILFSKASEMLLIHMLGGRSRLHSRWMVWQLFGQRCCFL